jgi:hypothetical protein
MECRQERTTDTGRPHSPLVTRLTQHPGLRHAYGYDGRQEHSAPSADESDRRFVLADPRGVKCAGHRCSQEPLKSAASSLGVRTTQQQALGLGADEADLDLW